MSFKLIEIQKPSPPGVLVIKARSRGSLTILLISLPIGIFAFLVLKDFSPSYTEPVKPFFIFNETFDAPSKEWWQEETDSASAGIKDGKYIIHFKENSGFSAYRVTQPVNRSAKIFSLEAQKISGAERSSHGLILLGKTEKIKFLITSESRYALVKNYLKENTFLNEAGKYSFSPYILQGNNPNKLMIIFHDDHLTLWVNGKELETIKLWLGFYLQRIGFIAYSDKKQKTLVHFDNLYYGDRVHEKSVVLADLSEEENSGSEFIIETMYQGFADNLGLPGWMLLYSWPIYLFPGLIALIFTVALKNLLIPTHHNFDQRKKIYLRNGKPFMKFNEIKGVDIQKSGGNTGEGGGKPMYVYPVSLILKTRKRIKLFSAGSEQEAYSLRAKIREILQFEDGVLTPEEKEEKLRTMDLPTWYRLTWLIGIISFVSFAIGVFWLDIIPESWKMPWFIVNLALILLAIVGGVFLSKSVK